MRNGYGVTGAVRGGRDCCRGATGDQDQAEARGCFPGDDNLRGENYPRITVRGYCGFRPAKTSMGKGGGGVKFLWCRRNPPRGARVPPFGTNRVCQGGRFCIWSARAGRARVPPRWGDDPAAEAEPMSCSAARGGLGAGASSEAAEGPERGMGAQPPCRPGRASGRAAYSRRKGRREAQEAPAPCRLNPALRIGQAVD